MPATQPEPIWARYSIFFWVIFMQTCQKRLQRWVLAAEPLPPSGTQRAARLHGERHPTSGKEQDFSLPEVNIFKALNVSSLSVSGFGGRAFELPLTVMKWDYNSS